MIEGAIEPRTGADGKHYAINVQLRVPADRNGRLMYQGGGGLNGSVGVAYGANTSHGSTSPPTLARGFAVVTTDSGHTAGEGGMADFARLFLVPGMTHCGGGLGLDDFDALGTLVDWVEKGRVLSSLVARGAAIPGQSRPICAFPAHAVFRAGSGREAGDYECRRS